MAPVTGREQGVVPTSDALPIDYLAASALLQMGHDREEKWP